MKMLASSLVLIVSVVFFGYLPPASMRCWVSGKANHIHFAVWSRRFDRFPRPHGRRRNEEVSSSTLRRHQPNRRWRSDRGHGGGSKGKARTVTRSAWCRILRSSCLTCRILATRVRPISNPLLARVMFPWPSPLTQKRHGRLSMSFVVAAKASPGKLKIAVASLGIPYLDMAVFMDATGIQCNLVATEGDGQTTAQLLGGHVDARFSSYSPAAGTCQGRDPQNPWIGVGRTLFRSPGYSDLHRTRVQEGLYRVLPPDIRVLRVCPSRF